MSDKPFNELCGSDNAENERKAREWVERNQRIREDANRLPPLLPQMYENIEKSKKVYSEPPKNIAEAIMRLPKR